MAKSTKTVFSGVISLNDDVKTVILSFSRELTTLEMFLCVCETLAHMDDELQEQRGYNTNFLYRHLLPHWNGSGPFPLLHPKFAEGLTPGERRKGRNALRWLRWARRPDVTKNGVSLGLTAAEQADFLELVVPLFPTMND